MVSTSSSDGTPGSVVQYQYMFEDSKRPTKQLDALLRAIARYIVCHRNATPLPLPMRLLIWRCFVHSVRGLIIVSGE